MGFSIGDAYMMFENYGCANQGTLSNESQNPLQASIKLTWVNKNSPKAKLQENCVVWCIIGKT